MICSNTLNTMMKVMLREDVSFQSFDLLYKDFSEKLWKRKLSMRNVQKNIKFKSEIIIYSILNELLTEEAFRCYSFSHEVRLADIFKKDGIFKNYGIQILRLETHSEVTKDTLKDGLTMLTEINYKVGKHI